MSLWRAIVEVASPFTAAHALFNAPLRWTIAIFTGLCVSVVVLFGAWLLVRRLRSRRSRPLVAPPGVSVVTGPLELSEVLEATSDFVSTATPTGDILYINSAGRRFMGIGDSDDITGLRIRDLHPEWAYAIIRDEGVATAVRTGRWQGDTAMLDASGVERLTSQVIMSHRAPDGTLLYLSTIIRDQTERRRTEDELRASKEWLEHSQRLARVGSWDWELSTGKVIWSEEVYRIFGVDPSQFSPTIDNVLERYHPDDRGLGEDLMHWLEQRREHITVEARLIWPNGELRHLRATAEGRYDENGKLIGVFGAALDITAQKRTEEELRQSRAMLQTVLDQTPVGIMVATPPDCQVTFANREAQRLCGASIDFLLNLSAKTKDEMMWSSYYPDGRLWPDLELPLPSAALRGVSTLNAEMVIRRADGGASRVLCNAGPVRNDAGEVVAGVATFLDITERHRVTEERAHLETQLRQSQKMEAVGQLAGGIAHDFNNILTAILGNAELANDVARNAAFDDELLRGCLSEIERAAKRAAALTRQLLVFSRRDIAKPEVANLNNVISDMGRMLRRLLTENISLAVRPAPDLHSVRIDVGQMEQVIMNLVVNGRDAMPTGGELAIETANVVIDRDYAAAHPDAWEGPHVMLSISDTGCGIDPAALERIFEPFFTTKPMGQGTGLGLSMVHGIIRQAGGHVTVESQPNTGTTFRVYLPAVAADNSGGATADDQRCAWSGTETVLLCEDDERVRTLATQMLTDAGYTVLPAESAAAALAQLDRDSTPIHLLLTDVVMGDSNGREIAEAAVQQRPNIKTLYMSGYAEGAVRRPGVFDEDVHFVEKPFSRRELLQHVRSVLDENNA